MDFEQALHIAAGAHRGQTDRAGRPYLLHPLRMMLAADSPDARVVALLHDVAERSDRSVAALRAEGLTPAQAAALDAVTRRPGESYADFIGRAARDPLGRAVKILDLQDNIARAQSPEERDPARLEKYRAALARLGG